MKKIIPIIAMLLIFAMLFGCTQKAEQKPPSETPEQPQITTPVEDIAAEELAKEMPSGDENLTGLDNILINAAG